MEDNSGAEKIRVSSSASHQRVQKSTTLNRRYVKKPEAAAIDSVAKRRAEDLKRRQALADKINHERLTALNTKKKTVAVPQPVQPAQPIQPVQPTAQSNMQNYQAPKPLSATIEKSLNANPIEPRSAKELKDSALKSALKSVTAINTEPTPAHQDIHSRITSKRTFTPSKVLLAFGCAALAVGAISYFVSTSTPDISVRVAAMQSGIEATYPSYIPRGYSLSDIISEEGKLTMSFSSSDNTSFTLIEEKSAWDNETLENTYVKPTWSANYTSVREQGITIFISGSDAAWVNGGIFYRLDASGNNLTKKQIKSIVVSL